MLFETQRLRIRQLRESDIDGFYDLHGNKNVMDLIPAKTLDIYEANEELNKIIKRQSNLDATVKVYAVILKSNFEFIGNCAMISVDEKIMEIGYRIRETFWKKGFGTELTKGLINFIFNASEVNQIIANVDSKNTGSIKILEKTMDCLEKVKSVNDESIEIPFGITRENWLQHSSKQQWPLSNP